MAKRRTSTAIVRQVTPRMAAPVINIRTPAAPKGKGKGGKRSRRRSGGGELTTQKMLAVGAGGAAVGFIEKSFPNLPTVPLIGRKGTIAILAYLLRSKLPMARDIGIAASAIAGYELGKEGRISGDVVPQIHGVAAQV